MKMFVDNKQVLKAISLIFALSLVFGLCSPFSVLAEDAVLSNGRAEESAPYVIFDGDYMANGAISKPVQGSFAFDSSEGFNMLKFTPKYDNPLDPSVTFTPQEVYSADEYKYITIITRANTVGIDCGFYVYYVAGREDANFKGDEVMAKSYAKVSDWQILSIDLSQKATWKGDIKKLRLDMFNANVEGDSDIAAVILSKTPQDVYDATFEVLMNMFSPKQVISDFTENEFDCFSYNSTNNVLYKNTKMTATNGILKLEAAGKAEGNKIGDPYVAFMYKDLMEKRGVPEEDRLTTEDFSYTAVRYRNANLGSSNAMELFLFTGNHYSPFQVLAEGKQKYATVAKSYNATTNNMWRCVSFQMNPDWLSETWTGDFNGFRIDWCGSSEIDGYMEISDIMFFDNAAAAASVTSALNSLNLALPDSPDESHPFLTPLSLDKASVYVNSKGLYGKLINSENATRSLELANDFPQISISTSVDADQPYVEMDVSQIDLNNHRYLSILVKRTNASLENFVVHYKTEGGEYATNLGTAASYEALDGWQVLTFVFNESVFENGAIQKLKLSYAGLGSSVAGVSCKIGGMVFSPSSAEAYDSAYYLLSQVYVPVQILTDFTSADAKHFGAGSSDGKTNLTASGGVLVYSAAGDGKDPGKMFNYLSYASGKGITPVTTVDFRYTVIRYRSQSISASAMELFLMTGDAQSLFDMATIYDKDPVTGDIIKLECRHCPKVSYNGNTQQAWKSVIVDMASTDGFSTSTHLKNAWYRDDGNYTFKGFRFDWCLSAEPESMLQVSDIIFYQNESDARAMSAALSAVSVPVPTVVLPDDEEDFPFEDETESETTFETEVETLPEFDDDFETEEETLPKFDDDSETEETLPKFDDDSETEETLPKFDDDSETEETIPKFEDDSTEETSQETAEKEQESTSSIEDSNTETEDAASESAEDVATELETESASESTSEDASESESASTSETEDISETETETSESSSVTDASESEGSSDTESDSVEETGGESDEETSSSGQMPDGTIPGYETEAAPPSSGGSQAPFYIACAALVGLSIASIVAVNIIKKRENAEATASEDE